VKSLEQRGSASFMDPSGFQESKFQMMSPAREWKLGNDATRVHISGDFPELSLLNEHTLHQTSAE
jgi:hypothetical protein